MSLHSGSLTINMKGINISCTSQTSTAITSSNMELLSSASSSSSTSSSFAVGGRAIDRHNPIITDERRGGPFSQSAPTTPCGAKNTPISPKPRFPSSPVITIGRRKKKSKKDTTGRLSNNTNNLSAKPFIASSNNNPSSHLIYDDYDDNNHEVVGRRKSLSKPSDLITKATGCTIARQGVDYISPPESSRYLLDTDSSFLDVLSDLDPFMKLEPYDQSKKTEAVKSDSLSKVPKALSSSTSSGSSDQVVVLRVSLHCRGCERKLKKHLSRMAGMKSFDVDFAAKKVTVVGDVTPLGVLASISKVKNAQLWTPAISSSFPANTRNMEAGK